MVAKFFNDIPLTKLPPLEIAQMVGSTGVVVLRSTGATPQQFADWSEEFGYHLSPDIWCMDKEYGGIFWRVTNQQIDKENQGLVADHELDWHCNITPVLDGEEVVGLYAKTITYPTETWFCNTVPYWQQLSTDDKQLFEKLFVILDPKRRLGRIQPGWTPNWEKIYSQRIIQDIYKNRELQDIRNSKNFINSDYDLFKPSRGVIERARLTPNHPMGTKGLFFTPYEIHGFELEGEVYPESKSLYWKIWNELIISNRFTYKHQWQTGDIVLMDQTITIHRRPTIDPCQPRELLRVASWYKKESRAHFDYVL
jgi:alpha-ketoglutarate-dependent taurine dioxygenase